MNITGKTTFIWSKLYIVRLAHSKNCSLNFLCYFLVFFLNTKKFRRKFLTHAKPITQLNNIGSAPESHVSWQNYGEIKIRHFCMWVHPNETCKKLSIIYVSVHIVSLKDPSSRPCFLVELLPPRLPNDIDDAILEQILTAMLKFAVDTKFAKVVETEEDVKEMQKIIDKLSRWEKRNSMRASPRWCIVGTKIHVHDGAIKEERDSGWNRHANAR